MNKARLSLAGVSFFTVPRQRIRDGESAMTPSLVAGRILSPSASGSLLVSLLVAGCGAPGTSAGNPSGMGGKSTSTAGTGGGGNTNGGGGTSGTGGREPAGGSGGGASGGSAGGAMGGGASGTAGGGAGGAGSAETYPIPTPTPPDEDGSQLWLRYPKVPIPGRLAESNRP